MPPCSCSSPIHSKKPPDGIRAGRFFPYLREISTTFFCKKRPPCAAVFLQLFLPAAHGTVREEKQNTPQLKNFPADCTKTCNFFPTAARCVDKEVMPWKSRRTDSGKSSAEPISGPWTPIRRPPRPDTRTDMHGCGRSPSGSACGACGRLLPENCGRRMCCGSWRTWPLAGQTTFCDWRFGRERLNSPAWI